MTNKVKPLEWNCYEYNSDPVAMALSPLADLLYRRMMDLFWLSPDCRFPAVLEKLYNAIGRGLSQDEFSKAWLELQHDSFEAFSVTKDGQWLYSKKLQARNRLSKKRADAGRKGGQVIKKTKTIKKPSKIYENTQSYDPNLRVSAKPKNLFEEILRFNRE